jgi:hypothetical protein
MLTQKQILDAVSSRSATIDGRDYNRLASFFPASELEKFGYEAIDGEEYTPREWTEENVRTQLAADVAFGFDKALNKRAISSGLMFEVVKMWMWVLEDPLEEFNEYAQYGLPYFKAVALAWRPGQTFAP